MKVSIANKSAERIDLENILRSKNPGEEIDVTGMELITKRKCGGALTVGHSMFLSAAKRIERVTNGQRVWRWQRDRKVYRCLLDPEKPADLRQRTVGIRSRARRNATIICGVDMSKLTTNQQVDVQVDAVVCALVQKMTSRKMLNEVAREVPRLEAPSQEVLIEAMKKRT